MWTSRLPVEAHLLYAVAYGLGGYDGGQTGPHRGGSAGHPRGGRSRLAGCRAARRAAGAQRLAAIIGAAIFASHAAGAVGAGDGLYRSVPGLFAVASVLAILCWQRDGHLGWLLVAGALAGFGLAAKLTMGLVIVALVVALALVGRGAWQWRERLLSLVAFGVGGLVVRAWPLRGYLLTGTIPGPNLLADQAVGTATSDLASFGLGRSPLDFLSIPWHLTFHGELFHQEGAGDIGSCSCCCCRWCCLLPAPAQLPSCPQQSVSLSSAGPSPPSSPDTCCRLSPRTALIGICAATLSARAPLGPTHPIAGGISWAGRRVGGSPAALAPEADCSAPDRSHRWVSKHRLSSLRRQCRLPRH